jgi:hypothetical protein
VQGLAVEVMQRFVHVVSRRVLDYPSLLAAIGEHIRIDYAPGLARKILEFMPSNLRIA